MRRTQVMLPEELRARADRRADAEGRSFAAVVRDALEAYLADDGGSEQLAEEDALQRHLASLSEIDIPDDAPCDGALNHDHYLYGAPKVES